MYFQELLRLREGRFKVGFWKNGRGGSELFREQNLELFSDVTVTLHVQETLISYLQIS